MIVVGHIVLFILASFAQFSRMMNAGWTGGAFFFLAILGAGIYFLGWWAILTFIAGGIVGGKLWVDYQAK